MQVHYYLQLCSYSCFSGALFFWGGWGIFNFPPNIAFSSYSQVWLKMSTEQRCNEYTKDIRSSDLFGDFWGQKSPKWISFWSQKLTFFEYFCLFLFFLVFQCFLQSFNLVFFSIVRHASTKLRKPAPRGMASQHLRTFERISWFRCICNEGLLFFCSYYFLNN